MTQFIFLRICAHTVDFTVLGMKERFEPGPTCIPSSVNANARFGDTVIRIPYQEQSLYAESTFVGIGYKLIADKCPINVEFR